MWQQIALEQFCCIFPVTGYKSFQIAGVETSPIPPPRGLPTASSIRSEFYINNQPQQQQQQQQQNQLHDQHFTSAKTSSGEAITSFTQYTKPNVAKAATVLSNSQSAIAIGNADPRNYNNNNNANFELLHEKFRKIVMKDITEYQSQKELKLKPLIQL